jgi:superfamily II DNA or RNA helicase
MELTVARNARCPCGSGREYKKCCGANVLRPTQSPGEITVWARAQGVHDQLRTLFGDALADLEEQPDCPDWARHQTVLEVLAAGQLLPFRASGLAPLREAAWAFLEREAESVKEGIAAEESQGPALAQPALAPLAARLAELREGLRRKGVAPRALARIREPDLRLHADSRVATYRENRKVRSDGDHRTVCPTVTMALQGYRAEPLPSPTCSCGGDACIHALAAVDVALSSMAQPAAAEQWAEFVRALDEPGWARALRALDAAAASRTQRLSRSGDFFISFRIEESYGGHLNLFPYVHKPLKRGGFSAGTRANARYLAERASAIAKEDRPALEVLGYLSPYRSISTSATVEMLEKLVGHPRVFFEDGLIEPLSVREAAVALTLRETTRGLELAPAIEGERIDLKALLRAIDSAGAAGRFVHVDRKRCLCCLVRIPADAKAVLSVLVAHGQVFPAEAEAGLVERLGVLEEMLPVEVPARLAGSEVPPERGVVLRPRLLEVGMELSALARPLPGAAAHPPGDGPSRLTAFRDGARVFVCRDKAAEEAFAREILSSLPVQGAREDPPFHVVVPDDGQALEIVERLGALERPDVAVEWVGEAPRLIRAARPSDLRVDVRDRHDWFGLSGEIDLDGEHVELALLLDAIRERRRCVRLRGGKAWLAIAGELAERLAPLAHLSRAGKEGAEIGPAALCTLDDLERDGASLNVEGAFGKLFARMRGASAEAPAVPASFTGVLRDYQVDGYRWLARLAAWGAGACLADDMGLGKTLQALALLCLRAGEGPALVVAPTSVCANWAKEAGRFAPSLAVSLYRETDREDVVSRLGPGHVLVASYGLVTRDVERLKAVRFATLVLDEAQAVKNAATRRARAVRELEANFRLALTGTPIENHLGELWSLMRAVFPGLLGSWEMFRERFALPIERDRDSARQRALSSALRPFLLRRAKSEVARELPSRTEIDLRVALTAEERRLYDEARLAAVARLTGQADVPSEGRRFQVLAAITKLRLLACHPKLYDPETRVPSSKLDRFLSLASDLKEGGHRALVFSQFTSHLALVREALDRDGPPGPASGIRYLYLDGHTPPAERDRLVERFQAGEGDLFLISLRAGGSGLNLTGADYVVHLDPWWNPAVEDQATDRAHRIGQTKPVTVYRLVTRGTIEEAIVKLHAEKRDLVAGVLDGMDAAGKLSPDDLVSLIQAGAQSGPGDDENATAEDEHEPDEPSPPPVRDAPSRAVLPEHYEELLSRFEQHLQEERLRGRLASGGTLKSYPRSVRRFLEHLAGRDVKTPIDPDFDELAREYLEALKSKRLAAPASEPLVARSALRRLGQVLRSQG